MIKSDVKLTLGVFGHYGNKNLGDESIIAAVLQNLRRRLPQARLYGLSINPADTLERHGIESFPIRALDGGSTGPSRDPGPLVEVTASASAASDSSQSPAGRIKSFLKRIPVLGALLRGIVALPRVVAGLYEEVGFLKKSFKVVKRLDSLLIVGSNQFLDNYGGPFAFPYTLLKWTVMAKIAGKKVAFVSVGAGPLDHWLSKMFVRRAIRLSDYCSLRDPGSQELVQGLGRIGETPVYPDLAYSLEVQEWLAQSRSPGNSRGTVGINPMPVFDYRYWFTGDAAKYRAYTEKLASFARDLIDRQYTVTLFPTQIRDELVSEDIKSIVKDRYGAEYLEHLRAAQCRDLPSLLELLRGMDFVIATRFHGVVLSLLMERPVLGICYQKKTFEVMDRYGLTAYAAHLETFQPQELQEKFSALAEDRGKVTETIGETNTQNDLALSEQYDRVLSLCLGDDSGATDE